ncbi:hypothetical protein BV210_09240 [Halorientalis sp. IM1011]|nr:hypothetical protein BV210_09240 [Halorientalis sp. IM1011]
MRNHLPELVLAVGLLFTFLLFGVSLAFQGVPTTSEQWQQLLLNITTIGPFVAAILYGGYWLRGDRLPSRRYPRIGVWFLAGLVGFLLLNVLIMVVWDQVSLYEYFAWAEFAAAVGSASGLGIGIFEARGIDRAVAAERHRVERQEVERRNDRLDEFASVVSHDIRNPLNVAQMRLELASEECDCEHVDHVVSSLERIEAIVDRSLALARSGTAIDETEPIDLSELSEQSWRNVATADAELVVDDPGSVEGDTDRLQQLFENLFRNSVEHGSTSPRSQAPEDAVEHGSTSPRSQAPEDAVEHGSTSGPSESTDTDEQDGTSVVVRVGSLPNGFYVEDDGPGVPEDERDAILNAGYTTSDSGTGLGLAIVDRVARAHGWEPRIVASDAGGARFEFVGATDDISRRTDSGADTDVTTQPADVSTSR